MRREAHPAPPLRPTPSATGWAQEGSSNTPGFTHFIPSTEPGPWLCSGDEGRRAGRPPSLPQDKELAHQGAELLPTQQNRTEGADLCFGTQRGRGHGDRWLHRAGVREATPLCREVGLQASPCRSVPWQEGEGCVQAGVTGALGNHPRNLSLEVSEDGAQGGKRSGLAPGCS